MTQSKQSKAIQISLAKIHDKRGVKIIKFKDQQNYADTKKHFNEEIRFNREILKGYGIKGVEYDEETKRQAKEDIEYTKDRLTYLNDRHDAVMRLGSPSLRLNLNGKSTSKFEVGHHLE
jgi:hypothetical protein